MSEEVAYTLKEIVTRLDIHHQERNLRNYLEEPVIRAHMEPIGGRAPRYPAASLPKFSKLALLIESGTITPKTLARNIENGADLAVVDLPDAGFRETGNGEKRPVPVPGNETGELMRVTRNGTALAEAFRDAGGEGIGLLRRLVEAVEARQTEQQGDRWIGAEEAMQLLYCSRRALGRRVRPVAKETWSLLQIQAYMRKRRERGCSQT